MRSQEGQRKVAIIAEADRLQPQAANAFLKTLEEPPSNSLLLLLSSLPEALPDTIVSRCICIPLTPNGEEIEIPERSELVELLRGAARDKSWGLQQAYRLQQGMQSLLNRIKQKIKAENDQALENEEARYRNATDGAWLEDRREYYKALTESLYIQRRAMLIEVLVEFWSDVLRAAPESRTQSADGEKRNRDTCRTFWCSGCIAANSAAGGTARQSWPQYSGSARLRSRLSRSLRRLIAFYVQQSLGSDCRSDDRK